MKRILLRLLAVIVAIPLLAGLAAVLFRDVPAGVYELAPRSGGESEGPVEAWAEVGDLAPVIRVYGLNGEKGPRLLMLPLVGYAIPLHRGLPPLSYDVLGGDPVEIEMPASGYSRKLLRRVGETEAAEYRWTWAEAHARLVADLEGIAQGVVTPVWRTALARGAFTLNIPEGYDLRFTQSNTDLGAAQLVPRGESVNRRVYLEFVSSGRHDSGEIAESEAAEFRLDLNAVEAGPHAMVTPASDGAFRVFATFRFGGVNVIARGRAQDRAQAADFVGILNAVEAGDAPLELLTGDYIPTAPVDPAQAGVWTKAVGDVLSSMLAPSSVLSRYNFRREYSFSLPDIEGREGYRGEPATITIGRLPRGRLFAEDMFTSKAEAKDRALRVSIDDEGKTCMVEFGHPIGPYTPDEDLIFQITTRSATLPDCQDAARLLAALDLDALGRLPEMERMAVLAPHAAKYTHIDETEDGGFAVSDGAQVGVMKADGAFRFRVEGNRIWRLGGYWVITTDAGWGLLDDDGKMILPAEHDEITQERFGWGEDQPIFMLVRNGDKYGLFDPRRGAFVVPLGFDRISVMDKWDFALAHRGETFSVIGSSGAPVLPGTFSDLIYAEPGRMTPRDIDFIALERADGMWVFVTRTAQPLLEGEFSAVRLEARSGYRRFHLTRADGETFTIDSFLQPVAE